MPRKKTHKVPPISAFHAMRDRQRREAEEADTGARQANRTAIHEGIRTAVSCPRCLKDIPIPAKHPDGKVIHRHCCGERWEITFSGGTAKVELS